MSTTPDTPDTAGGAAQTPPSLRKDGPHHHIGRPTYVEPPPTPEELAGADAPAPGTKWTNPVRNVGESDEEGCIGPFRLAGWGWRVFAYLIDLALTYVVTRYYGLGNLLSTAFTLLNVVVLQGFTGWSVGKLVCRMQLVRPVIDAHDGHLFLARPGVLVSFVRWFGHLLDYPLCIGYLRPFWQKYNQTFGDSLVGTVVLRSPLRPKLFVLSETDFAKKAPVAYNISGWLNRPPKRPE